MRKPQICAQCGIEYVSKCHNNISTYCSKKCDNEHRKGTTYKTKAERIMQCLYCGEHFDAYRTGRKYCDRECYIASLLEKKSGTVMRACDICGKEFATNIKYKIRLCSVKCMNIANKRELPKDMVKVPDKKILNNIPKAKPNRSNHTYFTDRIKEMEDKYLEKFCGVNNG